MFNLTIRNRLIAGFAALIALIFAGLGYAVLLSRQADSQTTELVEGSFESIIAAESAKAVFYAASNDAKEFLQQRDRIYVDSTNEKIAATSGMLRRVQDAQPALRDRVQELDELVIDYQNTFNRMVDLHVRKGLDENSGLQGSFRNSVHDIEESVKAQGLDSLTVLMLMSRRHEKDYLLRGQTKYIDRIGQRIDEFETAINELRLDSSMRQTLMSQWNSYYQGIQALVAVDDELAELREEFEAISVELTSEIDDLEADLTTQIDREKTAVLANLVTTRSILAAIFGVSVLFSIVVTFWIVRSITGPLKAVNKQVEEIVSGNLWQSANIRSTDEIGSVMKDIESMREQLVSVIGSIKNSTQEVTNAVGQVTGGNTELSTRTQEQAAALEEIASSMEQMTATVSRNAENADRANKLASAARSQAEQGGDVVRQAMHAMEEIDIASKRIEEIIRVIDDIAFQINLLALNAAVEAARAGEQGRGFAVVASEVRNLAGRSATAAKEIKELIMDSVGKVDSGRSLVDESGNSLEGILESVKQVSDTVAEIAAASREQSEGINQVNRSITHMDDMTQRNASLVEEVAATAESMGYQSQHLDDLVRFFKLEEHEQPGLTAPDADMEMLEYREYASEDNFPRLSKFS